MWPLAIKNNISFWLWGWANLHLTSFFTNEVRYFLCVSIFLAVALCALCKRQADDVFHCLLAGVVSCFVWELVLKENWWPQLQRMHEVQTCKEEDNEKIFIYYMITQDWWASQKLLAPSLLPQGGVNDTFLSVASRWHPPLGGQRGAALWLSSSSFAPRYRLSKLNSTLGLSSVALGW